MLSFMRLRTAISTNLTRTSSATSLWFNNSSVSLRHISTSTAWLSMGPKSMKEERYRKKDKVPLDYRIIYKAPMDYYMTACNYTSTFSFVAFGAIAAFAYLQPLNLIAFPYEIEFGTLAARESDLPIFLGFFLLFNIGIRIMVNRYPLRIYRNDEKYLAVFEGSLPLTKRILKFRKGDVMPVPLGGILPWQDARYKINGKRVFLLDDYFRTPSELNAMIEKI
ncbi:uncharacterized protein LOC129770768 [Toxorhynchites rutilus septentrionalis]|uniref:uncharacterized protein LOC129770768 n=1 Tax=Toxorhynchites rutilus septentrionalis TaxID=329112 RepID=UPI0024791506|nr:uncharacterized protein LOC129770768 [Toxorhynchites rutilus septentrionalis]